MRLAAVAGQKLFLSVCDVYEELLWQRSVGLLYVLLSGKNKALTQPG